MAGGNKKDKKVNRDKRGLKLFFLPKLQGQKHKHKKNKYYVNHHDDWSSQEGSIMSGDSPSHHNRTAEVFDYHPSSSTHVVESKSNSSTEVKTLSLPTTSKDVGVQSNPEEKVGDKTDKGEAQSSVMVEPGGDKDNDDKDHFGSPTLNNGDSHLENNENGEEKRGKSNDGGHEGRDKKDRKDDKFRKNGNIDKLDGVWVQNKDKKESGDNQEDNCIVKCLYVTMTCCECSIM